MRNLRKFQDFLDRVLVSSAVAFLCLVAGCNPVGGLPDVTEAPLIYPTLTSAVASRTNPVTVSIVWNTGRHRFLRRPFDCFQRHRAKLLRQRRGLHF